MAGQQSISACESKLKQACALLTRGKGHAKRAADPPAYLEHNHLNDYNDSMDRVERHIAKARGELDEAMKWTRNATNVLSSRRPR